ETEQSPGGQRWRATALVRFDQPILGKQAGPNMVTATVQDPNNVSKQVTIGLDKNVLHNGKSGILLVQFASDLATLLGDDEEDDVDNVPGGGLVGGTGYFLFGVLIEGDLPGEFDVLDEGDLMDKPALLKIFGADPSETDDAL